MKFSSGCRVKELRGQLRGFFCFACVALKCQCLMFHAWLIFLCQGDPSSSHDEAACSNHLQDLCIILYQYMCLLKGFCFDFSATYQGYRYEDNLYLGVNEHLHEALSTGRRQNT